MFSTTKEKNSFEEYLRLIYIIENSTNEPVGTTELARALNVAPSSVTEMLQKLQKHSYVDYQKYYGATLTELGRIAALIILNKHRLLQTFLVDFLGFDEETAKEEADLLVHSVSLRLSERICSLLDRPDWLSCKEICQKEGPAIACNPHKLRKIKTSKNSA